MAKLFLESTDTSYTVSTSNTKVFGDTGDQAVVINGALTGITINSNVERVQFTGATTDYTYKVVGTNLEVYKAGTLVSTVGVQTDTTGTQLTFANGTVDAKITGLNAVTVGGQAVSSTAATAVTIPATAITVTPIFSVSALNPSAVEGTTASFTVSLNTAQPVATTVKVATGSVGSSAATLDYGLIALTPVTGGATLDADGTVHFPAGITTATITVPVVADTIAETGEGVSLTLSDASVATATATVLINDTSAPTFSLATTATSVTENNAVTYTVTASSAPTVDTTLTYLIEGIASGVAKATTPADDIGKVTGTVTIKANETTGTFTLTPLDDGIVEGYEAFNVSLLDASFAMVSTTKPVVIVDGAPKVTPVTKVLTSGIDNFVGTTANDVFTANDSSNATLTLTTLDSIDGGLGNDVLNVTLSTNAIDTTNVTSASIKGIETASLISGSSTVTANTTTWEGLTSLSTSGAGAQTVTAATTTDITVSASAAATAAISVQGGNNVTVTASGITGNTGVINVGTITAPKGTVTVTANELASQATTTADVITVKGGTAVTVNANLTGALNNTITGGAIGVTGTSDTTSVTVNQTAKTAGQSVSIAAVVDGQVTVTDGNLTTAADTITTVSLSNYDNSTVASNVLSNVTLKGGSTSALTSGTLALNTTTTDTSVVATTLNLNMTSGFVGAISGTQAAKYTTVNIASAAAATIDNVTFAAATTLNASGAGVTTLTANTGIAAVTAINSTGGGLSLGTALGNTVAFTGGAGKETITVGATTKVINTGAGDDAVTVTVSALGTAGSIEAGDGNDTLTISGTLAATASANTTFAGTISGFERLSLSDGGTVALNNLDALNYVTVSNGTTVLNGALTGATVVAPASTTSVTVALLSGSSSDVLNVNLAGVSGTTNTLTTLVATGFETLNIASDDTATTATGIANAITTITDADAKSIVVSGDAGLTVTTFSGTALTLFDASGVTAGAVGFTASGNLVAAATLTGGAGADTLNAAAAATATVTLNGNAGNDTLTGSTTKSNTINGGLGDDTLSGGAAADSIDGGDGIDTFVFSSTTLAEQSGSGTTTGVVINLGSTALTTSTVYGATSKFSLASVASNTAVYLFSDESGTNAISVDTLANIENATGSTGNDYIVGSATANTITGGAGSDTMDGGAGNDRYDFTTDLQANTTSNIVVTDTAGAATTVAAGASADTIATAGMDRITVTAGDTLYLGSASNVTLDDMLNNTNDTTNISLVGNGNVGYLWGTLSGTTFTVTGTTGATAMLVAWDGDASDSTPENAVILTGVTFGTPTLATGVLTIV